MFEFWRKRSADDTPPPDVAPRHGRRWVEALPRFLREKITRLCGTEQDALWEYAAEWPVEERIDRLWSRIDWQAKTVTQWDVTHFTERSAPYPSTARSMIPCPTSRPRRERAWPRIRRGSRTSTTPLRRWWRPIPQ